MDSFFLFTSPTLFTQLRNSCGYYIKANSAEEALEKMAERYPKEVKEGFTVQEWESFNVVVVEVKRDE